MLPQSNLVLKYCMIPEQQVVLSQHEKPEESDFNFRKYIKSGNSRVDVFDNVKATQAKSRKERLFLSIKTTEATSHQQS